MIHSVQGDNALTAWQKGAALLRHGGEAYNLVTEIERPVEFSPDWMKDFDPRLVSRGVQSLDSVVNTIFPWDSNLRERDKLYRMYRLAHKKCSHKRWGTYFQRMISFGSSGINQLEKVICAMSGWKNNYKAAFRMSISNPESDSIKPIGAPCLQYVQVLCPSKSTASLFVVYRNHDFYARALGNFIGLGFLLKFICEHTNRTPENLVCHSVHAFYDQKKCSPKKFVRFARIE